MATKRKSARNSVPSLPAQCAISEILGLSHPDLSPPKLIPFGFLQVDDDRFQVRNSDACTYVQSRIKEAERRELRDGLQALIKSDVTLDPLVVWRDADGVLWVIDGHHRHEAMTAAGTSPDAMVWIQEAKASSEAEARIVALEINKRLHLALHPKELQEALWRGTLCGELTGSVRERAKRFRVSVGTVHNMGREAPRVLEELQRRASAEGVTMDAGYIRENAPLWKKLRQWWKDTKKPKSDDMQERERQRITQALLDAVSVDLKAQPEVVAEVFEVVAQEVTGKALQARWVDNPQDEF